MTYSIQVYEWGYVKTRNELRTDQAFDVIIVFAVIPKIKGNLCTGHAKESMLSSCQHDRWIGIGGRTHAMEHITPADIQAMPSVGLTMRGTEREECGVGDNAPSFIYLKMSSRRRLKARRTICMKQTWVRQGSMGHEQLIVTSSYRRSVAGGDNNIRYPTVSPLPQSMRCDEWIPCAQNGETDQRSANVYSRSRPHT